MGEELRGLRREGGGEGLGGRAADDRRASLLDVVELLRDVVEELLDVEVLNVGDGERGGRTGRARSDVHGSEGERSRRVGLRSGSLLLDLAEYDARWTVGARLLEDDRGDGGAGDVG